MTSPTDTAVNSSQSAGPADRTLTREGGGAVPRRSRFEWTFLLLALPGLAIYMAFLVWPVLASFIYSFTRWDGINEPVFAGLTNYQRLFSDRQYGQALLTTLAFAAIILVGQVSAGLGLALLLNKARRGTSLMRAAFFTPALLSTAVIALIWGFVYNPLVGVTPLIAQGLGATTGPLADVLGNASSAIWAVSGVVIWQYAGYIMVIYLAGLKNVPLEVYEAADLDGATGWRRFRSITWPLIAPSTTVAVTISLAGNLKLFDQVFLLTGGGPAGATDTAATLIYRTAFSNSNYGYSVTQSVILTLLTVVIVIGQRALASRSNK
ncbi:raffinose/stachyose/melibiose transport system permease protein [Cryobacterium sp. MP_M5]|uniref:carbohydrate ABC transporter permease n=1 Tax=unclassified Cryobacterium TaxID=2649013 RepID=UPI0018CBD4CC|nr:MULTISPECIES: sugar ABC transporter permease [unclassified Cryobacterium]MBG6057215.1 raffinose/stachyose/melibiose transport system permease protein [Cryobacterium sp. MP_M3]MEC5175414.1 raffinose/stachyose/melibiose transport system permease protein [Cryobacterium sp. MP_M5]